MAGSRTYGGPAYYDSHLPVTTASKIKYLIIGTVFLTLYNFGNILSILTIIDIRSSLKVIKMINRLYLYMFDRLNLHQPHFFLLILVILYTLSSFLAL